MSGGDTSIEDNECQCSLIERCRMCRRAGSTTSAYATDVDAICGCRKNRCDNCGVCQTCEGCFCGDDDRGVSRAERTHEAEVDNYERRDSYEGDW